MFLCQACLGAYGRGTGSAGQAVYPVCVPESLDLAWKCGQEQFQSTDSVKFFISRWKWQQKNPPLHMLGVRGQWVPEAVSRSSSNRYLALWLLYLLHPVFPSRSYFVMYSIYLKYLNYHPRITFSFFLSKLVCIISWEAITKGTYICFTNWVVHRISDRKKKGQDN